MAGPNRHDLGRVFNEVPQLYDQVRPGCPDELFADLISITRIDEESLALEVGCGTGQATRPLAAVGCSVTAIEPGADMAALARGRLATLDNVKVETSTFEKWDDHGRRFHVIVAASAWHWVDPSIGWRRAHDVLYPGGWVALLGNVHRERLEAVRRLPDLAGAVHALVDSLDLEGEPNAVAPPGPRAVRARHP